MTRGLKEVVGVSDTADSFLMWCVVHIHMPRQEDSATEKLLTALERACRSAVGDRLRSVTIDSPQCTGTVYQRADLGTNVDQHVRDAGADCGPTVADGGRTITEFGEGYVARFQHGDTCIVVTTDGLKMDRETELSAAVRGLLSA